MSNARRDYTEAEQRILYNQVKGICPLCADKLQYKKNKKTQKKYQIAHIYPLNPTNEEAKLLESMPRLSSDVNDLDNVIPLCLNCHEQFDKPRTAEEYMNLYHIKRELVETDKIMGTYSSYTIEDEIVEILKTLNSDLGEQIEKLDYNALKVDEKIDKTMNYLLKKRIKDDISD